MSRSWEFEKLYYDAFSYFEDLIQALEKSRRTITYETYIFEPGRLSDRIIQTMKKAQSRGVNVRLLIDAFGSPRFSTEEIPMKRYHALLKWLNKRNHRKVCIIDEEIAFLGGMNVADDHMNWRDTGVQLKGQPIEVLTQAFDRSWKRDVKSRLFTSPLRSSLIRLNNSRIERTRLYIDLLRKIRYAKNRVWLTTAYFVPTRSLVRALRRAARTGTDIRIIAPGISDIPFIRWVSFAFYRKLLKAGVRIFEYQPKILHAKTMIIDEWCCVGSTNLNHRSLLHDQEVDAILTREESRQSLKEQFEMDLSQSKEILLEDLKKNPWWERFLGRLLLGFRSWI